MSSAQLSATARAFADWLPSSVLTSLRRIDPAVRARMSAQQMLEREPGAARGLYRRLADERPGHPMHWIGLGLAEAALGDMPAAAEAARQARLRVGPRDRANLALSDLEQKLGRTPEALDTLRKGLSVAEDGGSVSAARIAGAAYAERVGDDETLVRLLEPLMDGGAATAEAWIKYLHAQMKRAGEAEARRLVREHARRLDDALPLHGLMEVYDALGRRREARLINRYLTRLWPHSQYHQRRYIFELARIGLGPQADRRLRAAYRHQPDYSIEKDFCERAAVSGEFREAADRYDDLSRRHPTDVCAHLAWGYARANAEGIDSAERHFELAASAIDNYSALVALAHMAMRRRDADAVARRWRAVRTAFPDDHRSVVEEARALFDAGHAPAALALCVLWRNTRPPHREVDEYYAWLLCAAGRFPEALAEAEALHRRGSTWTAVEIAARSSGELGRLRAELPTLLQGLPPVATFDDARHLYAVLRLFEYFDCSAAAFGTLLPRAGGAIRLDWAWPYLLAHAEELKDAGCPPRLTRKAQADHRELCAMVDDRTLRQVQALAPAAIERLLAEARRRPGPIHIVNMFEQASGGSELHALDLGDRLKPFGEVNFWAPEFPHPHLHDERGVRAIDPSAGACPRGGVLIFIGVYFALGAWLREATPERILVLYNTFDAVRLSGFVRTLHEMTGHKVEVLFCSDMMRRECGLPGLFEPSPIDLDAFPTRAEYPSDGFVIGRHSRDVPEKHNVSDAHVYRAMIEREAEVRLLGATCMSEVFGTSSGMTLLPARRGGVRQYLEQLDVFYYRTGTWIEPWGRVVIEAMALGLPVVVHERGGYAEAVDHDVDGFVFRTDEEAIDCLTRLKDDVQLRRTIGRAARKKVEKLLGPSAMDRLLAVYLARDELRHDELHSK